MSENENHEPSTNGNNGRLPNGRFGAGNPGGPGNPHARRVAQLRAALMEIVTPERLKLAAEQLMKQAEAGDRAAFAELCDRVLGKSIPADLQELVEQVESLLAEKSGGGAR